MIGIDAVDVERLRDVMGRTTRTEHRLFTPAERIYCLAKGDPVVHFAGTLAVKEAVIKAARLGSLLAWSRRIEVRRDGAGVPRVEIQGASHNRFEISISHDGPVAVAVAISRGPRSSATSEILPKADASPKPNEQLMRYLAPSAGLSRRVRKYGLQHVSASVAGSDFP